LSFWQHATHLRARVPRVEASRQLLDLSGVRQIGIDEASAHAKTPFITVVVDMERRRAVFVTPGKGSDTLQAFAEDLKQRGGDPTQITEASCDMSAAFIAGIRDHLPAANITCDKFHLTKLVIEAMDEVRRDEADSSSFAPLLAGSIVALRRNPENQRPDEALHAQIIALPQLHLKTGKAYRLKLAFQDAFSQAGQTGVAAMARWCAWAQRCRLAPFRRVARTIRKHWDGVVRYFTTGLTNAILEGINSLIQSAKARARGFRTTRNLIAMVYVVVGKLPLAQVG
jgi:transposase